MVTEETGNVPKWFAEFAERNAREHGQLAEKIAQAESRSTRWMLGGLAVAVSALGAFIAFIN